MTGGASDLASFVNTIKSERKKMDKKLDKALTTLENLELRVHTEGEKNGTLMQQIVKKMASLDRTT